MSRRALAYLDDELAALDERQRRRARHPASGEGLLDLTSNDYLGYAAARPVGDARAGAGASRLISGTHGEHAALEREVAGWLRVEDALVFASGYQANLGLVSALAGPGDLVVSDALNHASLIDGCRLSRARVIVTPHLDVAAVARALAAPASGRRFVVTEGYFSMDGDAPDLRALRAICDDAGAALLVDDAHAIGVFGPEGRGACAAAGVVPDALVGTFGKALGGQGAFVAGSAALVDWLFNRARSFVFSTGLSPALASHASRMLALARADEPARQRLARLSRRLRAGLFELGLEVPAASSGPIVPVMVGTEGRALALAARLREAGVRVAPIRPPTVPEGTCRLRLTLHAGLTDDDVERALLALRSAA